DNSAFFDKLILVPYQPSSENLLVDFAARIRGELPSEVKLYSLKLRETVTSLAEWYASDND
ncbi:MAG TPA: 6-carboxytetrahydropterin synthase QueD, partial [Bacteroidales bacterium]|nr:6-carboxytetrahydropterin synthase QueD [Bacteroidales bacterium]